MEDKTLKLNFQKENPDSSDQKINTSFWFAHRKNIKNNINNELFTYINHIFNRKNNNCSPTVHTLQTELDSVKETLTLTKQDVGANSVLLHDTCK